MSERDASGFAELPFSELLDRFAERTAAPGGGSAAAAACALAGAVVEMAAAFDMAPASEVTARRASALRVEALELGERDLRAYAPVLDAVALPAGDDSRPARIAAARSEAAEPPLAIAGVAAELAELAAALAVGGNPALVGDAVTAALIAEAACRSGVGLVELNLDADSEDPRCRQAQALARRAAVARSRAVSSMELAGGAV